MSPTDQSNPLFSNCPLSFPTLLKSSFGVQINQLSIYSADTMRTAITTWFITLCSSWQADGGKYKSLRFNLTGAERRVDFPVTVTSLQATHIGDSLHRLPGKAEWPWDLVYWLTMRLLNKPPSVYQGGRHGWRDAQNKLKLKHRSFEEHMSVAH